MLESKPWLLLCIVVQFLAVEAFHIAHHGIHGSASIHKQRILSTQLLSHDNRYPSSSSEPVSNRGFASNKANSIVKAALLSIAAVTAEGTLSRTGAAHAAVIPEDMIPYIDNENKFSLILYPGWSSMPRKVPSTKMSRFLTEESLYVASNFVEGGALSVTRTNPNRLLKDFDIEWWFAPASKIDDLGSAQLLAELLILQRQGDFEKKSTPTELIEAKYDGDDTLRFKFNTPLYPMVSRETTAKAVYRNQSLMVLWVSALTGVWESEYARNLNAVADSFTLV
jgi:hypothetical protein